MIIEPILGGLALAACAGLRVFMPFLFLSVMTRYAHTPAPAMLSWVGSDAGFLVLLVATIAEVLADKIPLVDHALDSAQTFIKPLAGLLLPVALLHNTSPMFAWIVGIVAGAPLALGIHATKAGTRVASSAATVGTANPIISTFEDVMAVAILVFTVLAPVLAAVLIAVLVFFVIKALRRMQKWIRPTLA